MMRALDVARCGLSLTPPVMCEHVRGWHQATPMFSNTSSLDTDLTRNTRAPHFTPQHWLLLESLGVRPGYAARFVSLAMSAGWV